MAIPAIAAGVSAAYKALPEGAKANAMSWVKQATNGAVQTYDALKKYATSSPVSAAVVAEGLVRSGAPVSSVIDWFDTKQHGTEIRASLVRLGQNLNVSLDNARPGVAGSAGDTSADVLRLQLIRTLVRAFGSTENARKVQLALGSLKSADFDWYDSVAQSFGR